MYITTIYSKLSSKQQKKILIFFKKNFNDKNTDFEIESYTIIILKLLENEIIGCICLIDNIYLLEKLNKNNIPLKYFVFDKSHGLFIYNLCIHKDYRNKKIGYNLLDYTIKKMKEIKIEYLHTQAENEISQMLFLKCGFIEDSNFKSLTSNETVYVMNKFL